MIRSACLSPGAAFLVFLLSSSGAAQDVDFVRGDVNNDLEVSISDVQWMMSWFFRNGPGLTCRKTADVNVDGKLNMGDAVFILNFLFEDGTAIPEPYPDPGPDEVTDPVSTLDCEAYDFVSPLEDPSAKLAILDAVAPGGDDATALITLAVSSSTELAGLSGAIRLSEAGILQGVQDWMKVLPPLSEGEYSHVKLVEQEVIQFSHLIFRPLPRPVWIQAGQNVPILQILACLEKGTKTGEYSLNLESVELADASSGLAIRPDPAHLVGGKLTVLADVTAEAGSACSDPQPPPPPDPPPPPPPPPPVPVDAVYKLGIASAAPGEKAALPFIIRANVPVQGYALSVDFDEEVLHAESVEVAWQRPDGKEYSFLFTEINGKNDVPGSAGVDEGFIIAAAVFEFKYPVEMPAEEDNVALKFHFLVDPAAAVDATEVRFLDGGKGERTMPVPNRITAFGESILPEQMNSFILLDGRIIVNPEIVVFVRGDSNGDGLLDISDPIFTLAYLFGGGSPPPVFQAADFNEDQKIDIADPVATLAHLFLGAK